MVPSVATTNTLAASSLCFHALKALMRSYPDRCPQPDKLVDHHDSLLSALDRARRVMSTGIGGHALGLTA
jgi:hypothetical protein